MLRAWFVQFTLLMMVALMAMEAFAALPPSRSDAVAFLSSLKEQNTARLTETDKAISKKLDDTKETRLLTALHAEIEKLRSEKRELLLRQDFLDRLILKVDSKYDGTHPREFLEGVLKEMARVEIASSSPNTMWPFLDNLRRLISRVPDQQDRVLTLVEGYMKQTSIENPMHPDDFLKNVAYSNGSQTESAKPMDRTLVGEFAEKRVKQITAQENHMKLPEPAAPVLAPATPSESKPMALPPPSKTAN